MLALGSVFFLGKFLFFESTHSMDSSTQNAEKTEENAEETQSASVPLEISTIEKSDLVRQANLLDCLIQNTEVYLIMIRWMIGTEPHIWQLML